MWKAAADEDLSRWFHDREKCQEQREEPSSMDDARFRCSAEIGSLLIHQMRERPLLNGGKSAVEARSAAGQSGKEPRRSGMLWRNLSNAASSLALR